MQAAEYGTDCENAHPYRNFKRTTTGKNNEIHKNTVNKTHRKKRLDLRRPGVYTIDKRLNNLLIVLLKLSTNQKYIKMKRRFKP